MTAGQRWRLRRNAVIWVAAEAGLSHRWLAAVFDLPHSRIGSICGEMRALRDSRSAGGPDGSGGRAAPKQAIPARRRVEGGPADPRWPPL
jgi:hypothetical protein